MNRSVLSGLIICFFLYLDLHAQVLPKMISLSGGSPSSGPVGNAITDIYVTGQDVWVLAGSGVSHTDDEGFSWTTFTQSDGLGKGGPSAISIRNGLIWVATAYDTLTDEEGFLPAGGGLGYSTDGGSNWTWMPQPIDSRDETEYKPTTTHIQNITYDIAQTDSAVWITSFGGGLRKSTDKGQTWHVVTVNGVPFDALGYLSHRAFSVMYDEENLWVGTAGGIHKSTDEGSTWVTFDHSNQPQGISGNFVVALAYQRWGDRRIIWAATIETDSSDYRGVSKSEDGGLTWEIVLEGEWTHNFAIDQYKVYAATDIGMFLSTDFGETWTLYRNILDAENQDPLYTTEMYSVGSGPGDHLWFGSGDGLVHTADNGETWKIYRAFQIPGEDKMPETYAYPNPFSPGRHNRLGEDGYVRFQYRTTKPTSVSVSVYDFGMNLVTHAVVNRFREREGDYAEVWDGKNDVSRNAVANGVYFYRIKLDYTILWGKVIVMN